MSRRRGGFLGIKKNVSQSDASGIWGLDSVLLEQKAGRWPIIQFLVEHLVVAGGGGGGGSPYNAGAGGGAGGAIVGSAFLTTGSYTVTIGAGAPSEPTNRGYNGSNSVFNSLTAIGGGGGGAHPNAINTGADGGSGGGGTQAGGTGGAGTPGQGNDGASTPGYGQQGGGGGAGAAATSFNGGIGIEWPVGSGNYYAGGGGSEERTAFNNPIGQGGQGGGGNGLNQNGTNSADTSGDANTGGGGGGGRGSGGSGVVILRYPASYTISQTGLTLSTTTVGNDKVTTITAGTGTVSWS
jgi:hypothetical protein